MSDDTLPPANEGPREGDRLLEAFTRLRALDPEPRRKALEELRRDAPSLYDEVSSLLNHSEDQEPRVDAEGLDRLRQDMIEHLATVPTATTPDFVASYAIEELIGEGGMGRVYAARQPTTGQRVALKLIRPGNVTRTSMRRFRAEVEFLGRLKHPGIARVFEAGEVELHGIVQPFIAMEFVEGRDFREWSHSRSRSEIVDALIRVARAVHHAHVRGVIHRDLKPGNILVSEDGIPRVLDFGVARVVGDDDGTSEHAGQTQTGQLVGTLGYMSPEQVDGRSDELRFASDVYALGVLGFEALAKRLPHQVEGLSLRAAFEKICNAPTPSLQKLSPGFPADLQQVVEKALARNQQDRYASAAALADDLERWRQHRPVDARPPSTWQNIVLFARRNRSVATALPVIMLALAGGIIVSTRLAGRASRAQRRAENTAANSDRTSYRLALGSAEIALQRHDTGSARRFLDSAPKALRGWEWNHLHAQLDQSFGLAQSSLTSRCLVRTPLQISESGSQATFVRYEGSKDGPVHVVSIKLEGTSLGMERRIDDIASIPTGERERPSFALLDDDRVVALDRERGVVWEEARDGQGTRRTYAIDEMPIVVQGPELEVRELRGIRVGFRQDGEEWTLLHDCGQDFNINRVHPAKSLLATVGFDGETDFVEVFDLKRGERIAKLGGFAEDPHDLAISPDATTLALAIPDGTIVVDRIDQSQPRRILRGHLDRVGVVAFSPDGTLIASGSQDGTVRLWDASRNTPIQTLPGHTGEILGLAFISSSRMVSVDIRGNVRQWNLDGRGDPSRDEHSSYVYPISLSSDGRLIASGDWEGLVIIRDARSGKTLAQHQVLETDRRYDVISDLEFLPGTSQLAVTFGHAFFASQSLRVIEAMSGATIKDFGKIGSLVSLAATTDPARLILATQGEGRVYETETWSEVARFESKRRGLAVGPQGDRFAHRIESYQRYQIRRAVDATVLHDLDLSEEADVRTPSDADVVAFSPNGNVLAMGAGDDILIVAIERGLILQRLKAHTGKVFSLAFSPDGRRLASGADDRTVRIWDTRYYEELVALSRHQDHVQTVLWSPDGQRLYSCSGDYTVRIWDTLTRAQRRALFDE